MRKKVVEMDGAAFTIAPLNLEQVEQFIAPDSKLTNHDLILASLNNAGGGYTETQLRSELDIPLRDFLFEEILKFSGLKNDGAKLGANAPGEAKAASAA